MPVLSRRPASTIPGGRAGAAGITAVAIAALAIVVGASTALVPPDHVHALSFKNPTKWYADVSVRTEDEGGWIALGRVAPGQTIQLLDILDAGAHWEFRFDYGGAVASQIAFDRSDLDDAGWTVAVPDEFAAQAEAAGLHPSVAGG